MFLLSFALLSTERVSIYISHLFMSTSHIYPICTHVLHLFSHGHHFQICKNVSSSAELVTSILKFLKVLNVEQNAIVCTSMLLCPYYFSHILQLYILNEKSFFIEKQETSILGGPSSKTNYFILLCMTPCILRSYFEGCMNVQIKMPIKIFIEHHKISSLITQKKILVIFSYYL